PLSHAVAPAVGAGKRRPERHGRGGVVRISGTQPARPLRLPARPEAISRSRGALDVWAGEASPWDHESDPAPDGLHPAVARLERLRVALRGNQPDLRGQCRAPAWR